MSAISEEEDTFIEVAADEADAGTRMDALLALKAGPMSRSRYKVLIKTGNVSIGGRTIVEPNYRVNAGDQVIVRLPPPEPAIPRGEDIPLNIVFEDDDLIVVDKPAGLVVHPAAGNWTGTLVNALIAHCGDTLSGIGGVRRPGIVHRLDKDTSGLLVVAKNDLAHQGLTAQFADHGRTGDLRRSYSALVWGTPDPMAGTIDAPLNRSSHNRLRQAVVGSGGKEAITHYRVEKIFHDDQGAPAASLVTCRLETGRTHQIRVHMGHIGHPLVGDKEYGAGFKTKANRLPEQLREVVERFPRQALHARLLQFRHPISEELLRFESSPPDDLTVLIQRFTKNSQRS